MVVGRFFALDVRILFLRRGTEIFLLTFSRIKSIIVLSFIFYCRNFDDYRVDRINIEKKCIYNAAFMD